MELANKNILIVGLRVSGVATACFLKNKGAFVTVTDIAREEDLGSCVQTVREMGVETELGKHRIETFESADLIVLSPGVPHTILPIKRAEEKGIAVIGEVELAYRFIREPIVAVTGTNGKTTTTVLLGKMLENSGFTVFVGGNIGNPLINYVNEEKKAEIVVAEISSFQLDTIDTFRPKVGVLLNISEDHLDRYPDFAAYARAKARIFENQQNTDTAVLNASDPLISSIARNILSLKLFFNSSAKTKEGIRINDKRIAFRNLLNLSCANLTGRHNIENASAAALAALAAGGTVEGIQLALNNFHGLPHRLEHVATINNVGYFNDSKATNVNATARALETFSESIILIMGGRDKGGDYYPLNNLVQKHVKELILMGEAKEEIKSALGHIKPTKIVSTMEDAVFQAYHTAVPGDVVLLSPACSSFDMYDSYAERGEVFRKAVRNLGE